ncbi:hypothetical protein PYCCODRAFT_10624 [Trametes coccinea BRFM310]|uniref:Heterokaryon incompatibility domain-containing protein n=1 Tax=Trametes coccinea (strain BRFM310) TaxID=1353009 RepID=A0A1Y2J784_TRAC3|nr:hypothetical protein PYCCODRAFT_10624 [Trametes coccinea BRFM310]
MGQSTSRSLVAPERQNPTTATEGLQNVDDASESKVRLSWSRILDALEVEVELVAEDHGCIPLVDVITTETDLHYRLFQDCIQYLREKYSLGASACSVPVALRKKAATGELPWCFSTLVNLQLDIQWSYKQQPPTPESKAPWNDELCSVPVLASIRFAMVATTLSHSPRAGHWHAICTLADSPDVSLTDWDLYQALFLDCMGTLLREAYGHRCLATWSPMPWSAASMRELSDSRLTYLESFVTAIFDESDLPHPDSRLVHMVRWTLGCPVDIPWLCASHDGYDFRATLPSYTKMRRRGLSRDTVHSLRDDAALWLSAMTFGLLEAITRMRIPESAFLVPGPREGDFSLSGSRLLQFIAYWGSYVEQHYDDEDMQAERGREIAGHLRRALHALAEEYDDSTGILRRAGFSTRERDDILFALLCLIVPFCILVTTNSRWPSRLIPNERLKRLGWCPSATATLSSRQFLIMIISNLAQLPPVVLPTASHVRCTKQACEFYTVWDPAAYAPRHVDPSCRCEYVRPPLDKVLDLLSRDIIPLVTYDGHSLQVLPADGIPYVAISHVWAQGMGSTSEDGLPSCMVRRIAGLARTLHPDTGAFWMDSLCVPNVKQPRKRAILHMSETYRDAASVLVIDDCIRTQCSVGKSWRENLLRIATSAWVRRVWTLQEGLLARELFFEFLDGPVNVEEVWRLMTPIEKKTIPPVLSPLSNEEFFTPTALVPVLNFRSAIQRRSSPETPVSDLVSLLHLRTTTKAEDELIAIGSLLPSRVKVERLLAERDGADVVDRRMRAFLLQLRDVPRGVPFGQSPRLTLPGFSWAPRALVDESATCWWEGDGTGTCTEDGFLAEYFMLPFHVLSIPPSAVIRGVTETPNEKSWGVRVLHGASSTVHLVIDPSDEGRPFFDWESVDALLFLRGDVSNAPIYGIPWNCLAVHVPSGLVTCASGGEEVGTSEAGNSQQHPLAVEIVAHWNLYRLNATQEAETLSKGFPALPVDDPRSTWVKVA